MSQKLLVSVGLAVTIMAMLSFHVTAQNSWCFSALVSLSPCLLYISGNSVTPSTSCCLTLSGVVKNEPHCLCTFFNGSAPSSLGVVFNLTKSLELPPACKVQTPIFSLCRTWGLGAPAAAPKASNGTTPSIPSTSPAPSPSPVGPKAPAPTANVSSDAIPSKSAMNSIFLLAVSALASMI